MTADVRLRPAGAEDLAFLHQVYASTRAEELAQVPWTDAQKAAFLRFQFEAQHKHYHEHFADADYLLIERAAVQLGRMYVHRRVDELRLLDIALLPEHRNAGIGGALIAALIAEAHTAGKPVRIHVEQFNPAMRLYQRLGFERIDEAGIYLLMECRPNTARAGQAKIT